MNSLSQLSRRYLKKQWKRTLFTSLGIVMATALFTGLALLFTSFINMYIETESEETGRWHYHVSGLTMDQARQLQANIRIDESELIASSSQMAKLDGRSSLHDEPSWLLLRDVNEMGSGLTPYPMTLLEGRMPENTSEIALNVASLTFFPDLKLNQTVELALQDVQSTETGSIQTKTYTVTGITEWTDTYLPGPVFYALTVLDEADKNLAEVYLTVKASTDFETSLIAALSDVIPALSEVQSDSDRDSLIQRMKYTAFEKDSVWENLSTIRVGTHDPLLRFLGQSSYGETNQGLIRFFALLAGIIMVSVIFVIRNSFAMSVSERTTEYGLLRVVGGSPSQIRRLVLQDAVQMALIGIPMGLLAGVVAMKITLGYVSGLGLPEVMHLKLIVSSWPLIVAAVLSLLSIMLAALSPALKAGKLSPMEAVRRTGVYTVRGKSSRKLVKHKQTYRKLLGITGFLAGRSIHRDRRRFRITTLSIIVSAVLFLAAGGISFQFSKQLLHYSTEKTDFRLTVAAERPGFASEDLALIDQLLGDEEMASQRVQYGQFAQPLLHDPSVFSTQLIEFMKKTSTINGQPLTDEQALDMIADQTMHVQILLADRPFLDSLGLPDVDELWAQMQKGKVILSQTNALSASNLSFQTIPFTRLTKGDTIHLDHIREYDQQTGSPIDRPGLPVEYGIAEELTQPPWFLEGFFSGGGSIVLIADRQYLMPFFDDHPEISQATIVEEKLAVDAAEGSEPAVYKLLEPFTHERNPGVSGSIRISNYYEEMQTARGVVKMLNIFVFGFAAVIVLICIMNILNTITTNVLLRRRELAMLQAVGMSRTQVRRMLLMECTLYGVNGAVWGSVIGTVLLFLLGRSIEGTLGNMTLQAMPWLLILCTLAGALLIAILAGIWPIRRVMKDEIVEAIRAQE